MESKGDNAHDIDEKVRLPTYIHHVTNETSSKVSRRGVSQEIQVAKVFVYKDVFKKEMEFYSLSLF